MHAVRVAALSCVSLLGGCAAILTGVDQTFTVETTLDGMPLPGVGCRLSNSKGSWFVTTPASILVRRAGNGLEVDCVAGGIDPGSASLKPVNNNAAFANILLGGVVGIAIDSGSGAAYRYPDRVVVAMRPRVPSPGDVAQSAALPPSVMATLKYQGAAENFARSLSCAARPVAVPSSFGDDGETYAIRCTSGDVLTTRCAADLCRVVR